MEKKILFCAGMKRHRGSLSGVFVLMFLVSLALGTVLTIWHSAGRYLSAELTRAGFGTITAWVSDVPDLDALRNELETQPEVTGVASQAVIYTNYIANGQESDSEGQLIAERLDEGRYRFFTDDLTGYQANHPKIERGEVYISPSMVSIFGMQVGDEITFPIARAGGDAVLTVKGFYEDPFMGSSMIGMKGFLICEEDYRALTEQIHAAGIDALAREGAMLHIFADGAASTAELNQRLNTHTSLPGVVEFVHTAAAIRGFMLILQNAFSGLLLALVIVLLAAVLVVLSHSIGSTIEADYKDMGILKAIGFTSGTLRRLRLIQYGTAILSGGLLGLSMTLPASRFVSRLLLTTSGIRIPARLPVLWCAGAFVAILLLLGGFISWKTEKIGRISPMKAIRGEAGETMLPGQHFPAIGAACLSLQLAVRQLLTGKRKYFSACAVAYCWSFSPRWWDIWTHGSGRTARV